MRRQRLKLETFLPYRLSITSNRVSEVIAKAYQSLFGLAIPEWRVVAVLAERGQVSQSTLGIATRMDKVSVSRAAIALSARGLIDRQKDPVDRRAQLLSLTNEGRELYKRVTPEALRLEQRLLSDFLSTETDELMNLLLRLEDACDRVAPPPS